MSSQGFSILAVCTGNICRSPIIERLLAARLAVGLGLDSSDVRVSSAGTWGHEGAPMEPFAAECLVDLGGDPAGFVARELDADMVAEADLILGASREHRAASVIFSPTAARRCFTMLEFARLLGPVMPGDISGESAAERLTSLVEAAAGNRGLVPPAKPGDDDIDDPYGGPLRVFARVASVIDSAISVPVALLKG